MSEIPPLIKQLGDLILSFKFTLHPKIVSPTCSPLSPSSLLPSVQHHPCSPKEAGLLWALANQGISNCQKMKQLSLHSDWARQSRMKPDFGELIEPTKREHEWTDLGPFHICGCFVAWSICDCAVNGSRACPWCFDWLLGNKGLQGSCSDISWQSWSMAGYFLQGITKQNWPP